MEGPRAVGELAFFATFRPLLDLAPHGDGHPVLVLPGLGAGDRSTIPMRGYLRRLGYQVHGWGLGVNRPSSLLLTQLWRRFDELYERHDHQPVSLIGWSLGGIYAREIARERPVAVRQVITLGSPFRDVPGEESHPTAWLRMMSPGQPRRRPGQGPLPVPSTAVFSRTDGIVPWKASRDVGRTVGPDGRSAAMPGTLRAESIEVISSHCGLGHHPGVLWAVADRLAQPLGVHTDFAPGAPWSALYPKRRTSRKRST
jgi:pimeloyl-ACP methyl ester carboxylesterase